MVNTAVNSNIYAGRKPGSKYNQSHTFQQKEVLEVLFAGGWYTNRALGQQLREKEIQNEEPEISNDSSEKMTAWYQGVPLKEWALTDPKYTDSETGISWYIRDVQAPVGR